jgi:uncharacterized membrane protein (DUF373 family)
LTSKPNKSTPPDEPGAAISHNTLLQLERLDNWAHVLVAIFFLILSASVLVTSAGMFLHFVREAMHGEIGESGQNFIHDSLEVLSSLLFAVIILELLRTIITYLQTRDTQAIMKEFLIVGIISSIRKILMVGAESSIIAKPEPDIQKMEHSKELAARLFVQESIGVVITVAAILLMIGGLILLNRHYTQSETTKTDQPPTEE